MKKNSVRFFGPLSSSSGYGNAVQNMAEAFSISNVNTKFNFAKASIEKNIDFYNSLNKYDGHTNIDFYLHAPPWDKHISSGTYKIGYFYWEADKLPTQWVSKLNHVDEIWAPCSLVADVCRRAGFKKKIKIVPTPGKNFELNSNISFHLKDNMVLNPDTFIFYSIFQWHYRKGFDILLESYLDNFNQDDNVALVLKVNPLNLEGYRSNDIINDVTYYKNKFKGKKLPMIYLSKAIIDYDMIHRLHSIGNCYVAPHRGEGWGMPIFDAMQSKSYVITTKYGGITDHLNEDCAGLIDYKLGPVSNMHWSPFYNSKQNWAHPSADDLGCKMKHIFNNKQLYNDKVNKGLDISRALNIQSISKIIESNINMI